MNSKAVIAAVLLTCASGFAMVQAQPGPPPEMPKFEEFDADQDGKITVEEFEQFNAKMEENRPSDGGRQGPPAPQFADIDTNQDNIIDQAEFDAQGPKGPKRG